MKNSLIILFLNLMFLPIFNIAHSMSCSDFDNKIYKLKDNLSEICIMNYINEDLIYARNKNEFYVFFKNEGLFLKLDQCVEKDNSSHIILSNILDNNKYEFNLNDKIVISYKSFEKVVNDISKTSNPKYALLYNTIQGRHEELGIIDIQLLEYMSHLAFNYDFTYLHLTDEFIKKFISLQQQEVKDRDELILYTHSDLHTDKDTEFDDQSLNSTTLLDTKVNQGRVRGDSNKLGGFSSINGRNAIEVGGYANKIQESTQTDDKPYEKTNEVDGNAYSNAMDLGTESTLTTSTSGKSRKRKLDDRKSTDSIIYQYPQDKSMKLMSDFVASEPPKVLSGSSEVATQSNSAKTELNGEIQDISVGQKDIIEKIIRDLDKNQAIELSPGPSARNGKEYSKIIIKIYQNEFGRKLYSVTILDKNNKEQTYIVEVLSLEEDSGLLQIRIVSTQFQLGINNTIERIKGKRKRISIQNYNLSILTIIHSDEKLDEIKNADNQVIIDLKQKYGQNLVSLIKDIKLGNKQEISDLIQGLNKDQSLLFIDNIPYFRELNYMKIEIIWIGRRNRGRFNHFNIYTESKEGTIESDENKAISVQSTPNTIRICLTWFRDGKRKLKTLVVKNFHLFILTNTKK